MSDIIIRGMEMPVSCFGCPLIVLQNDGGAHCKLTCTSCKIRRINPDCPLVDLPPHGDLIDRSALMEEHAKAESGRYGNLFVAGGNRFIHRFLDAPVIIPATKKAAPAATGATSK